MDNATPLCPICHRPTTHSVAGDICIYCEQIFPFKPRAQEGPVPSLAISLENTIGPHTTPLESEARREAEEVAELDPVTTNQSIERTITHRSSMPQANAHTTATRSSLDIPLSHRASQNLPQSTNQATPLTDITTGQPHVKHGAVAKAKANKRIRQTLRRLMVPELPNPLQASTTLSSHESVLLMPGESYAIQRQTAPQLPSHAWQEAEKIAELNTPAEIQQPTAAIQPNEVTTLDIQPSILPLEQQFADALTTTHEEDIQIAPINVRRPRLQQAIIVLLILGCIVGIWLGIRSVNSGPAKYPTISPNANKPSSDTEPSAAAINRDTQRKKDLQDIATALEVYKAQQGAYPIGSDITAVEPLQFTTPPYISLINSDPLSTPSNKITYQYSSDGSQFTLKASLESKKDQDAPSGVYIVSK